MRILTYILKVPHNPNRMNAILKQASYALIAMLLLLSHQELLANTLTINDE